MGAPFKNAGLEGGGGWGVIQKQGIGNREKLDSRSALPAPIVRCGWEMICIACHLRWGSCSLSARLGADYGSLPVAFTSAFLAQSTFQTFPSSTTPDTYPVTLQFFAF